MGKTGDGGIQNKKKKKMTTKKEEYKERIEMARSIYEGHEEEWKNRFSIFKGMSDEKAIRLIAKIVIKGVIRRWSE